MIGLTFLLQDNHTDPTGCDVLLDSYSGCTSSGREAEIAEQIAVAALRVMRLEQSVCVVRKGSRTTVKGQLTVTTLPGRRKRQQL